MRSIKTGVRLAAIASGQIGENKHTVSGRTVLIAVIAKKSEVEGVLSSTVAINGTDSSNKILEMIKKSRFGNQVRLVVLNGIALAGLNVVDATKLSKNGFEVMVITRHKPRPSKLVHALSVFAKKSKVDVEERKGIVRDFAKNKPLHANGFYVQSMLNENNAIALSGYAIGALRLAHMIASGISKGESKGRI
ncbi:MAG: DUF99 family protein [Candidatus Micrarchaeia archaeon]